MLSLIEQSKKEFETVVEHLKQQMKSVRTGRATPALVDHVMVEAYGVQTPLRELAAISTPDARTLVIQPWDANVIKDIEKGIQDARLNITPVVEGKIIRLSIPSLTEESRAEIAKQVSGQLEDAKQMLRRVRDDVREKLLGAEKTKAITEDDRFRGQKDLDSCTQDYQKKLVFIAEEKAREVMTL